MNDDSSPPPFSPAEEETEDPQLSRGHRWFYSCKGEKLGPVTFSDLQERVKEGKLNPRLDLVWKYGMDGWQAAGEIEGLFERAGAPAPREELAPSSDPYVPPQGESVEEQMGREQEWPGARRRSYLAALFLFPFLWSFGFAAASGFLTQQFGPEIMKAVTAGAQIVPAIVCIYFAVKRLINVGMSGWWWFGNLVPFLNIWVGYRCFACPGGYAYHKKLDGIGVFLAIVYWLLIVVGILAVSALVALLFGVIGSPELQQKIREFIQQVSAQAVKP
ncbi:MAG: GYF domain-containing protein [Luteolibacter sp.]